MHKPTTPKQKHIIIKVEIAMNIEGGDTGELEDEISALLTQNGIANPDSLILDWRYLEISKVLEAPDTEIVEEELFCRYHAALKAKTAPAKLMFANH
ncbi:MAG: hypothetical protein IPM39_25050 [Chloroflexi bacterium]|nr:hypothetical protein [Chloroflexota bacterium]